jgi:hypothetical protein
MCQRRVCQFVTMKLEFTCEITDDTTSLSLLSVLSQYCENCKGTHQEYKDTISCNQS